jgi:hypothetical protein
MQCPTKPSGVCFLFSEYSSFFKIRICLLWGRFIVTILIWLILYIGYIAPIVSPPHPLPAPLKMIARGFFVPFRISI